MRLSPIQVPTKEKSCFMTIVKGEKKKTKMNKSGVDLPFVCSGHTYRSKRKKSDNNEMRSERKRSQY